MAIDKMGRDRFGLLGFEVRTSFMWFECLVFRVLRLVFFNCFRFRLKVFQF
jgi:hypothetical protein